VIFFINFVSFCTDICYSAYNCCKKANFVVVSAEEDNVTVQLYEKPVPETDFVKHCDQRRKYPILLKVSRVY
jgi:hypothetical protein